MSNRDDNPPILLIERESYAIITLNRPAELNRLSSETLDELAVIITSLHGNISPRTLIITGRDGVFSVGADLNEVAGLDATTAYEFSRRGQSMLSLLEGAAPIVIAAIDGYCLGGGLDLALSCDLRYATPSSSFQHPGVKRGIITGWGGTQRLPRLIGAAAAHRLLVTGEAIDSAEALRLGLINSIHEDALGYACRVAERIAERFSR
ncbi:MAG: enoyl-CoA hydratase/isomerase family protein [Blastocatellia bacterium]|nr:enoyl-CoA hydratase/isomerase family protein [Blastocatellia bacterium]